MKTSQKSTSFASHGIEQLLQLISLPENANEMQGGIFKGKVQSAMTGSRVFGCVVELVGTGRTYITSPSGYFKITDLPEGIYLAKFSFPGFQEVTEAIAIMNGESLDMTLDLKVEV